MGRYVCGVFRACERKPWVAQSAHSRVYNMIKDAGIEEEMVEESIISLVINYLV